MGALHVEFYHVQLLPISTLQFCGSVLETRGKGCQIVKRRVKINLWEWRNCEEVRTSGREGLLWTMAINAYRTMLKVVMELKYKHTLVDTTTWRSGMLILTKDELNKFSHTMNDITNSPLLFIAFYIVGARSWSWKMYIVTIDDPNIPFSQKLKILGDI